MMIATVNKGKPNLRGTPANFLDVGWNASENQVLHTFKIATQHMIEDVYGSGGRNVMEEDFEVPKNKEDNDILNDDEDILVSQLVKDKDKMNRNLISKNKRAVSLATNKGDECSLNSKVNYGGVGQLWPKWDVSQNNQAH
ncbi:hypothetical protein ACFE04_027105 [Oxalis oulophora]